MTLWLGFLAVILVVCVVAILVAIFWPEAAEVYDTPTPQPYTRSYAPYQPTAQPYPQSEDKKKRKVEYTATNSTSNTSDDDLLVTMAGAEIINSMLRPSEADCDGTHRHINQETGYTDSWNDTPAILTPEAPAPEPMQAEAPISEPLQAEAPDPSANNGYSGSDSYSSSYDSSSSNDSYSSSNDYSSSYDGGSCDYGGGDCGGCDGGGD